MHSTLQTWATSVAPLARAQVVPLFAACLFLGGSTGAALGGLLAGSGHYGAAVQRLRRGCSCRSPSSRRSPAAGTCAPEGDADDRPAPGAARATLPPVAPRPTLRDVATAAGVHPATASRALNEATRSLVRPATVARVREVAGALGYQVNPIARSLKTSRSETVGVLVPDLTNPLFPPIVRGIEDALAEQRLHRPDREHRQRPRRATSSNFAAMQARQVDGFIVATALLDDPLLHEAAARGVPMVMVNRQTEHAGRLGGRRRRRHRHRAHGRPPGRARPPRHRAHRRPAAGVDRRRPPARVPGGDAAARAARRPRRRGRGLLRGGRADGAAGAARRRPADRDRRRQRPARARLLRRARRGGPVLPRRHERRRLQRHAVHRPAAAAADLGAGAAVRARRRGGPAAARPAHAAARSPRGWCCCRCALVVRGSTAPPPA